MDYEWYHYIEDLKADKPFDEELKKRVRQMRATVPDVKYQQMKNLIKGMLLEYRKREQRENRFIEELVKAHARYCQLLPDDETAKNRHNAIVYRYMIKTALTNKAVALKLGVSLRTMYQYLDKGIEELMIICFGVPVLSADGQQWSDRIKRILDNYQLIRMSESIYQALLWENWQRERCECMAITSEALNGLERLFALYKEFAKEAALPEYQKRSVEVVKMLYIDGKMDISEVGDILGLSNAPIYSDIKKMTERLGELAEATQV